MCLVGQMKIELAPLPYDYTALEPKIGKRVSYLDVLMRHLVLCCARGKIRDPPRNRRGCLLTLAILASSNAADPGDSPRQASRKVRQRGQPDD